MYPEQTFDANGVQINFVQASTSGPPVVLLHGVASEWKSFQPVIPALSERNQVYALDLRGHGKSGRVRGGYRLADYATDIGDFLSEQIGRPAALYGHSLGALVALAVAGRYPDLVRALALGDPPFYYHDTATRDSVWYEGFKEMHHVLTSCGSAAEIEAYMAGHYPNMDPQRRRDRAETLSLVDAEVVAAIMEDDLMAGVDSGALLRQVACPVLLLQGNPELGSALRAQDVTHLRAHLRHCEPVFMPQVGHGLPTGEALFRLTAFLDDHN